MHVIIFTRLKNRNFPPRNSWNFGSSLFYFIIMTWRLWDPLAHTKWMCEKNIFLFILGKSQYNITKAWYIRQDINLRHSQSQENMNIFPLGLTLFYNAQVLNVYNECSDNLNVWTQICSMYFESLIVIFKIPPPPSPHSFF